MPLSSPTISVAMATFNGAAFLSEQLESIAAQTLAPAELVICDDRSTDETVRIATAFGKCSKFPVGVHVNPARLGYARNFRRATSLCSGELIAFSDQDDWWFPERLEVCAPHFDDAELQLLYHNARLVDKQRRRSGLLYDPKRERAALELEPVGPWNHSYGLVQIFRSSLRQFDDLWDQSLNDVPEQMDIMSHDQWYFFLAEALGRAQFLDRALVEYRQHGSNSVSAAKMRPAVEDRLLRRLAHDGAQDLRRAKAAEARCSVLRQIASRVPEKASRLEYIAALYEILAERSCRRFRTYSAHGYGLRLKALIDSWRHGDYSQTPWGFNKWSVIRDLWSGVVMAKTAPGARRNVEPQAAPSAAPLQ